MKFIVTPLNVLVPETQILPSDCHIQQCASPQIMEPLSGKLVNLLVQVLNF